MEDEVVDIPEKEKNSPDIERSIPESLDKLQEVSNGQMIKLCVHYFHRSICM